MTYANKDNYKGTWKDNKRHGQGTMTYANKDIYEGTWTYDKRNDQGKMTYENGDIYEGEWFRTQRHGNGTMRYANGDIYDGEWYEGYRDGQGTMTYANGEIRTGLWIDDNPPPPPPPLPAPLPTIEIGEFQQPTNWTCSICISNESHAGSDGCTSNRVIWLTCGHKFHTCCILQWLQTTRTCPNCRKEYRGFFTNRPQDSTFEGSKRKKITKRGKRSRKGQLSKRFRN